MDRRLTLYHTVSPVDWPSRPARYSHLRLRDPPPRLQDSGRLQQCYGHRHSRVSQVVHRPSPSAELVRPVREPFELRYAAVFVIVTAQPRDAHCDLHQYRRCERRWPEAVLEPQEPHAGCQCVGDSSLPGDVGSYFRMLSQYSFSLTRS